MPDLLRGFVELVYDLNNHPSFRLFEPLLYGSIYYDQAQQSLMLEEISNDDRPFILSTPRLNSERSLHLRCRFADSAVDDLFKLKCEAATWGEIRDMLLIEDSQNDLARSLFTTEAPPPYAAYTGPGFRWRYFGHVCILVECRGRSILVDPVLSYTYESSISRYTYLDLPDSIDFVLITHNHQDHVLFETLLQIRHKGKNLVVPRNGNGHLQDPSLKLILENCGFNNVVEMTEMDKLTDGGVSIMAVPFLGEHADLDISTKLGWFVRTGPYSLLFAADSCNIEPRVYEYVHNEIGDVDVLFLGMECDGAPLTWLYGPLLTQRIDRAMDESRRLSGSNCEQGINLVNCFRCREVYVYAMGQEPWLNHVMTIKYTGESRPVIESDLLIRQCTAKGIVAERLFGEKEVLLEAQ